MKGKTKRILVVVDDAIVQMAYYSVLKSALICCQLLTCDIQKVLISCVVIAHGRASYKVITQLGASPFTHLNYARKPTINVR